MFKNVHLDVILILSAKYLEKLSQSYFTNGNFGKADGEIQSRMLFIEFHRRRGLSELSEIT